MIRFLTFVFLVVSCHSAAALIVEETVIDSSTVTYELQPADERALQDSLPISQDPLWAELATSDITADQVKGTFAVTHSAAVKKRIGAKTRVSGFVMPLDATDRFNHFLLSRRTPTCFFCPPGAPHEIIEVKTVKNIAWEDAPVTVEGIFGLTHDAETGIFFTLTDAQIIK